MRHNSLRDAIANLLREVCVDVQTEPMLLPVNPNNYSSRTNVADGARLDVSARGLKSTFERTFIDVRVCHPHAASNVVFSLSELYKRNEKEKEDKYGERVRETEKGSFSPMVFLTTGGSGPECTRVLKTVAAKISQKRGEQYSHVMSFIRTKLRFSLLKSVLIAIRGERGNMRYKEPNIGYLSFNIIPQINNYDA